MDYNMRTNKYEIVLYSRGRIEGGEIFCKGKEMGNKR